MKIALLLFLSVLAATCGRAADAVVFQVSCAAKSPTDETILKQISLKETGGRADVVGALQERTQYQFRPATWKMMSSVPHREAVQHPAEVERVARAYLKIIRAKLAARGLPATSYFIAASWNAGPDWKRINRRADDYATCVENMVESAEVRGRWVGRGAKPTLALLTP